ncbi:MAG: phosphotransferase [Candidatus Latescibacteria bacterium]|nr:phosphotransferase [Candidatus Latescibacterota bacterium]
MPITNFRQFQAFRVSLQTAAQLCELHHLAAPTSIRRLGRGEVNAVFDLTLEDSQCIILKVGVRDQGVEKLQREQALVHRFQQTGELPVPQWTKVALTPNMLPHPHMFMEKIGGRDGDTLWANLDEGQRRQVLRNCGATLHTLHQAALSETVRPHFAPPPTPAQWAQELTEAFQGALANLRSQSWIGQGPMKTFASVWDEYCGVLAHPFEAAILHGDFQLHNLRLDSSTLAVAGLLDWDNACLGPGFTDARDFELNLFLTNPKLALPFWEGYGKALTQDEHVRLKLTMLNRALQLFVAYQGPMDNYNVAAIEKLARSIAQ